MGQLRDNRSGFARAGLFGAFLAVFLRAFIPVGFMVAPSPTGGAVVVLCTGHGQSTAYIGADGKISHKAPAQDPAKTGHGVCAFAQSSTFSTPIDAQLPLQAPVLNGASHYVHARDPATLALLSPPPPARGPPSLI